MNGAIVYSSQSELVTLHTIENEALVDTISLLIIEYTSKGDFSPGAMRLRKQAIKFYRREINR
jgi:hypothetical protein